MLYDPPPIHLIFLTTNKQTTTLLLPTSTRSMIDWLIDRLCVFVMCVSVCDFRMRIDASISCSLAQSLVRKIFSFLYFVFFLTNKQTKRNQNRPSLKQNQKVFINTNCLSLYLPHSLCANIIDVLSLSLSPFLLYLSQIGLSHTDIYLSVDLQVSSICLHFFFIASII